MSKITITLAKGCEFENVPAEGVGIVADPKGKLIHFCFGTPYSPKDQEGKEIAGVKQVDCERVLVSNNADYADIVSAMIASRYSVNAELALHRQRDSKAEDFAAYNEYAEQCKVYAHKVCKDQ